MRIFILTSEYFPYAKTGGLGDAVASFSAELAREEHDVCAVLPHYKWIDDFIKGKDTIEFIHGLDTVEYGINRIKNGKKGIKIYLLENPDFFDREGIYSDPENNGYQDNILRFSSFSRAALELIMKLGEKPDVIHIHDWALGLVPLYIKSFYMEYFKKACTVLTIHNIGYQGIFSFSETGNTHLKKDSFGSQDNINFLKTAVIHSDRITTVSKKYATEIQTPFFGQGLESILASRSSDLTGILNGVDYNQWNPLKDEYIRMNYDAEDIEKKKTDKAYIQEKAGLKSDPDIPLVGMISRLTDQKGIEELFKPPNSTAVRLMEGGQLQMIVLGTGEKWCEAELKRLGEAYENFAVFLEFNNELSHQIEAGCDFFLMPSRYEPCGLNQIYSLRYGTVPIVRKTGGLADTIIDEKDEENGNGFCIDILSPFTIYETVLRAVSVYCNNRERYKSLQQKGMKERYTWEKSVHEYLDVFSQALKDKKKKY